MKSSKAEVVVNQPIYKMFDRTISITGYLKLYIKSIININLIYKL